VTLKCWQNWRLFKKKADPRQIVYIKRIGTHEEYDKWELLTTGFDMKRYGRLLAKASPRVICDR
jgi:hypothetical protein